MKTKAWPIVAIVAFALAIGCGGGGTGGGGGDGGGDGGGNGGGGGGGTTVSGRVIAEGTDQGIAGVQVKVFDAAGTVVANITTAVDGRFKVGVPLTATRFHLDQVPAGYYKTYYYRGKVYTTLDQTCSAPLPPIVDGSDTPLLENVRVPDTTFPPPPPPTGCP